MGGDPAIVPILHDEDVVFDFGDGDRILRCRSEGEFPRSQHSIHSGQRCRLFVETDHDDFQRRRSRWGYFTPV